MSDTIVLQKVYAVDSNTGLFISSGKVLMTDGLGGTNWVNSLSTLEVTGGPVMNELPSSISTFYATTYLLSTLSSLFTQGIEQAIAIANATSATIQTANLGSLGYVSTATLSTAIAEAMSTVTQSPCTVSSLVPSLSTLQYANSSTLSTLTSSAALSSMSSVIGLGSSGYVSTLSLISTVAGLGSLGYISTINTPMTFQSTVAGLGTIGYASTSFVYNVINTMGNQYVSTASLASTVNGLSTFGYVTNIDLSTAVLGVSAMKNSIRFDTVGNVILSGSSNQITFTNTANVIYISTFYQSSMYYTGAQPGVPINGRVLNLNDFEFSTAVLKLDALSSFINNTSKITIDVIPTYMFSKLGTGAAGPTVITISTLLKSGNTLLNNTFNTAVTNSFFAGNTQVLMENGLTVDSSNVFNQPIKLSIPPRSWDWTNAYTLYHYMPNALQYGAAQNYLHSASVTPFFGSTGSIFISVQNSV
jgi:hypothetical protein